MPASLLRPPLLLLAAVLVALTAAALFAGGAPTEAQSPATVTRTDSEGKTIEVRAGKYYTIGLTSDDNERITAGSGWIGEGNLGEFAVAVGEVPPASGLAFVCSTVADSAGEADYVGGSFPINEQSGGPGTTDRVDPSTNPDGVSAWSVSSNGVGGLITLPIVTKSDYELEGDEYFWIECLPSRGSQKDEWQAWPSPRLRVRIVDDTTAVRFAQPAYTFTEGATGTLQAIALSDYGAAGGEVGRQWDVTASVITSPTSLNGDARITEDYTVTPASLAFARSREPKEIAVTLADNDICEAPKTFTVRLAEPSGWQNDWGPSSGRSQGTSRDRDVYVALGSPATARVTIIDDGDKLDAPQGLRAELDGSTLKVSEWRRPPGCLANGVEMQYKLSTASSWTAGYKGGLTWDYDNDGDHTNNNGLARDVEVDLGSAPAADAVYDVRVRLHNNATGGGKWAQVTTVNETAEFSGLTVTSPDGSVTYELGRRQGSGFESGFEVSYYYVHVPPGLREVQVTVDWTATPTPASVNGNAQSYAFTGGPPKSVSARVGSSVELSKNSAATVPLAAVGGTDVYLELIAGFTSGEISEDEVRLVVLRNNAWKSANDLLEQIRIRVGP